MSPISTKKADLLDWVGFSFNFFWGDLFKIRDNPCNTCTCVLVQVSVAGSLSLGLIMF